MLIFTNRVMKASSNESSFGTAYSQGSERLGMATVGAKAAGWSVTAVDDDVDQAEAKTALDPIFKGPRPIDLHPWEQQHPGQVLRAMRETGGTLRRRGRRLLMAIRGLPA